MKKYALLLGLIVFVCSVQAALANTALQKMVQESDMIVLGEVADIQSHWNADHTLIYSDITVNVQQVDKGTEAQQVTIRMLGGRVDDMALFVTHSPSFAEGEQVLLFLYEVPTAFHTELLKEPSVTDTFYNVYASTEGKFTIEDDPVEGHIARRDEHQSIRALDASLEPILSGQVRLSDLQRAITSYTTQQPDQEEK